MAVFLFLKIFWEIEDAFHSYCILRCYYLRLLTFLPEFSFLLRGVQFLHVLANRNFFFSFWNWPDAPSYLYLQLYDRSFSRLWHSFP